MGNQNLYLPKTYKTTFVFVDIPQDIPWRYPSRTNFISCINPWRVPLIPQSGSILPPRTSPTVWDPGAPHTMDRPLTLSMSLWHSRETLSWLPVCGTTLPTTWGAGHKTWLSTLVPVEGLRGLIRVLEYPKLILHYEWNSCFIHFPTRRWL